MAEALERSNTDSIRERLSFGKRALGWLGNKGMALFARRTAGGGESDAVERAEVVAMRPQPDYTDEELGSLEMRLLEEADLGDPTPDDDFKTSLAKLGLDPEAHAKRFVRAEDARAKLRPYPHKTFRDS